MQLSAQQTSASITDLHNRSTVVELRELAKEFRGIRRDYDQAKGEHEDLMADLAADPSNSNLQRRTNRAEDKVKSLYTDMHNVLHTLKSQCISYGQSITTFVQQEDADLLTQICHDA